MVYTVYMMHGGNMTTNLTANYKAICRQLGMKASIRFVVVRKDGITFTGGRPDEIRALLQAVRKAGLKPAPSLLSAVRSFDPYNCYLAENPVQIAPKPLSSKE